MTVTLYFTQVINKRKHIKHIMVESSFEFTVSSKHKPILIHELGKSYGVGSVFIQGFIFKYFNESLAGVKWDTNLKTLKS